MGGPARVKEQAGRNTQQGQLKKPPRLYSGISFREEMQRTIDI